MVLLSGGLNLGKIPAFACQPTKLPALPRSLPRNLNPRSLTMGFDELTPRHPPKQQMLLGGEERKNKEEHQIPPRSRSKSFPSLRGEIDWWNDRSRSPLSFPSNWKQESWRNREIAKLKKVNNGGPFRAQQSWTH